MEPQRVGLHWGRGIVIFSGTAFVLWAATAQAQDVPKPDSKTTKSTEVTVTAKRPEVVDFIDRRIYNVKSDPQAETGVLTDILKKLPLVTVAPDGTVSLRGDANIAITIDGKAPRDGALTLKTFPARQIDRIEVITNPSAQYDANGTGGIINIITKRTYPSGLSGGANIDLDTSGSGTSAMTTDLNVERWTLGAGLNASHQKGRNTSVLNQETLALGAATGMQDQKSRAAFVGDNASANLRVTYRSPFVSYSTSANSIRD